MRASELLLNSDQRFSASLRAGDVGEVGEVGSLVPSCAVVSAWWTRMRQSAMRQVMTETQEDVSTRKMKGAEKKI